MTRFSLAASITSLVTDGKPLISTIRVRRRFSRRKLPPVIWMIEAAATVSIASVLHARRLAEYFHVPVSLFI